MMKHVESRSTIQKGNEFLRRILQVLFVVLAAVYFRGWESLDYVRDDPEIGKKVHFVRQMFRLSNLPEEFMGSAISRRYSSILWEYQQWRISARRSPDIDAEEVSCEEIFTVDNAFYVTAHGILRSIFSGEGYKYYVVTSENYQDVVVIASEYDAYSKNATSASVYSGCGTAHE